MPMTNPPTAHPGGFDEADVVAGDPPVPVNIWRLPPGEDRPVGTRLATRMLAEYTRPGESVYDAVPSDALRQAAHATGRSYRPASRFNTPADPTTALAVAAWPATVGQTDPVITLGGLRRRIRPGGILAIIITDTAAADADNGPVELGPVVAAATTAGLSYLQHVVTMPTANQPTADDRGADARAGVVHQRVHTDLLVFTRIGGRNG